MVVTSESCPSAGTLVSTTTRCLSASTSLRRAVVSILVPSASTTVSFWVTLVPGWKWDQYACGGLLTVSSGFGSTSAAAAPSGAVTSAVNETARSNTPNWRIATSLLGLVPSRRSSLSSELTLPNERKQDTASSAQSRSGAPGGKRGR